MYRCPDCTLATLVGKAFDLRTHQFPAGSSLGDKTFEVTARIPAGAIPEEFQAMLQNLLKERFGLAYHFQEKKMRGFHLVLARDGSKLKESGNSAGPSNARTETHRFGQGENHTHTGVINFGGMARYHGDRVTAAGLARILSDQLGLPVDDQTGLTGTYEVSLTWNGNTTRSDGIHGFAGHADHGGVAADSGAASGDSSGPTLFEAVQTQLGLKLVAADQTTARIFVVDHVDHVPTGN
jgi:uncharacterized protein (TIGR03435 family)